MSDMLMWNKIGRIVTLLSERLNISSEQALDLWYNSKTNERLHDPSTLLYTFSDMYIVDDLINEKELSKNSTSMDSLPVQSDNRRG